MAKKRDSDQKDRRFKVRRLSAGGISSKKGAAGVSCSGSVDVGTALAQVSPVQAIQWTYEADIVIIGGGCTGCRPPFAREILARP
jgi:hypothetical protein